jgi:hypothetical protein
MGGVARYTRGTPMWFIVLVFGIGLCGASIQSTYSYFFAPRVAVTVESCQTNCYGTWTTPAGRHQEFGQVDGVDPNAYEKGDTFTGYLFDGGHDDRVRPVGGGPERPAYLILLAVVLHSVWVGRKVVQRVVRRRRDKADVLPAGELLPIALGIGLPMLLLGIVLLFFAASRSAGFLIGGIGLMTLGIPIGLMLVLSSLSDRNVTQEWAQRRLAKMNAEKQNPPPPPQPQP